MTGKGRPGAPGPPPEREPGSRAVGLVTLLVLLAGVWGTSEDRVLPSPVPAEAPDTVFSSGRAMDDLVEMARAPRPVGSPEHTRVRQMIVDRLTGLGLESELHTTTSLRASDDEVRAVTLRNVLARVPGTASTGAVVLMAHYDAVPLSAGAGDDATGVAAVLEVVRALRAVPPLENDVIVLITDAEEMGLLGARAFVEEHPWMDDVSVVLNVEMRGGGGPVHMFETGAENGWIVRAMQASDPRPFATSLSVEVYRRLPNDTDFTPFREAGVQGLNFAAIGRSWVYHQPTDVPANIQEETLQHHGMRVLAIARELGGRDLSSVHAPDLVYTTLPGVGIVAYPQGWALPLSLGLLVLWIAVVVLATGRGARWTGVAAGLGATAVAAAGAWGLGSALMGWLPRFHPEHGAMTPAFYGEGWYVLGLVVGALVLMTLALAVVRRWFSVASLGAGAVLVPVAAAVGMAAAAPLTAIELQIPAFAGVLAVGAMALRGGARPADRPGAGARAAALLLALPALAVMVPLFQGLWASMGFHAAPALGVLAAVAAACLVPALEGLGEPNRWWAPSVGTAAAVLLVAVGVIRADPSPERPVHSTLLYALDREREEALWATREDPGLSWAEERVGPFAGAEDFDRFLLPLRYRVAGAPPGDFPEPAVRPLGPAPEGPAGTVRLALTSEAGAELLSLGVPEGRGSMVALNGRPLPPGRSGPGRAAAGGVSRLVHQGVPEGELTVDVAVEEGREALDLVVVEHHLRPWEYLGRDPFERPPHLVPSPPGRSDRAVIRTPVTLPVRDIRAPENEAGG